jgi:hypothetical protein
MRVAGRIATLGGAALIAVFAGFGWLYVLHRSGHLAAGPDLPEALPLQRLAGGAAQPVSRMLLAWLPAGLVAGVALKAVGMGRWRGVAVFVAAAVVLIALGASADAVTASEQLLPHVVPQLSRAAIWMAAALVGIGAAVP